YGWIRPKKRPVISTNKKTTHSNKQTAYSNVAVFLSLLICGPLGGFQAYLLILSHQLPLPYFILSTLHGKVVQCVPFSFYGMPLRT
ncbi:hypothetical protein ABZE59_020680, partial [Enterobacter cloacae subsp. cloacae]